MMHTTSSISDRIVNLGTRSYRQRLETLSGIGMTEHKLKKLNRDLDDLYDLLYERINSISESEVRSISPLLSELIKSVKALYSICRKPASRIVTDKETERLGMNYSALQELYSDLQNFRLPSENDKELKALLSKAATLMQRIS
ncbi:MAG: hypothetical protein K2L00_09025 [Muribaculaceae bacterium]|nr:hypothetical protein [Muribaculaceae bacterium]